MQNFLALLSLINQMLPAIHTMVVTAESLFPNGGSGAEKLAAVDGWVQAAARVAGMAEGQVSGISSVLGPIVSGIVSLANVTGLFKSSAATVTAPLSAPVPTPDAVAAAAIINNGKQGDI